MYICNELHKYSAPKAVPIDYRLYLNRRMRARTVVLLHTNTAYFNFDTVVVLLQSLILRSITYVCVPIFFLYFHFQSDHRTKLLRNRETVDCQSQYRLHQIRINRKFFFAFIFIILNEFPVIQTINGDNFQ